VRAEREDRGEGRDELVSIVCYYHSSSSPLSSTAEGREREMTDREQEEGGRWDGLDRPHWGGEHREGEERRDKRERGGRGSLRGYRREELTPETSVVALNLTMVATGLGSARGGRGFTVGLGVREEAEE
jgi:hypothetical protein